jgi:glutathione S-transferase
MPRPDIAALGVQYRRIPVVSMGRDIYCDSLLILEKLDSWYPASASHPSLGAKDATGRALERLLEKWTDVVVFSAAAAAIPSDMDLCKDPAFQKDREELWGRPWTAEEQDKLKPAGLANMKANFDFLEDLLEDGRQWVLGSDGPALADIHGKDPVFMS